MGNAVNIGLLDHSFQHLFEEAPFAAALYAGPDFIIEMAKVCVARNQGIVEKKNGLV